MHDNIFLNSILIVINKVDTIPVVVQTSMP